MPEATESNALQAGPKSEPPLTSLQGGAHDAPPAKPPQPAADAGRRWSSRAPKTIARFVAEAAPPPSFLRTVVEREGVVPSDVSTTAATSLKPSLKQPHGGAQRKPRGAPPPSPWQRDPDPTLGRAPLITAVRGAVLDTVTHRCPKGCGFTTTKSKAMAGDARACHLRDSAPTPLAHGPAGDEPGGAAAPRASAPGATAGSDSEDDQPLSERPRGQALPVDASASAEAGPSGEAEAQVEAPQEAQQKAPQEPPRPVLGPGQGVRPIAAIAPTSGSRLAPPTAAPRPLSPGGSTAVPGGDAAVRTGAPGVVVVPIAGGLAASSPPSVAAGYPRPDPGLRRALVGMPPARSTEDKSDQARCSGVTPDTSTAPAWQALAALAAPAHAHAPSPSLPAAHTRRACGACGASGGVHATLPQESTSPSDCGHSGVRSEDDAGGCLSPVSGYAESAGGGESGSEGGADGEAVAWDGEPVAVSLESSLPGHAWDVAQLSSKGEGGGEREREREDEGEGEGEGEGGGEAAWGGRRRRRADREASLGGQSAAVAVGGEEAVEEAVEGAVEGAVEEEAVPCVRRTSRRRTSTAAQSSVQAGGG